MKSRKKQISSRKATAPQARSTSLVALPTETLRERAQRNCERAAKAFADADRELRSFEREDLPAFETWKALTLGPLIVEFRQRSAEFEEKSRLYSIAMHESSCTGLPPWEALEAWKKEEARVLKAEQKRRERGEPEPALEDEDFDDDLFEDDAFEDEMPSKGSKESGTRNRAPDGPSAPRAAGGSSLREVYRRLCRILHPDAAGEMTPERRDVWHQVQEAYAIGDIGRLENLLARVADSEVDVSPRRPRTVGEIIDLQKHYQRAKQKLGPLLREARQHPAWRFSLLDQRRRARLRDDLEYELRSALRAIQHDLAYIERELTPRRGYRRSSRGRSRAADEFY